MEHEDWTAEVKRLTKLDLPDLQSIRREWDDFLAKTESTMRDAVNDWHVQQTLGLYAHELRRMSDYRSAIKLDERIGDDAEKQIKYWHSAAGHALAQAAMDRFQYDESDERAIDLARRALDHLNKAEDSKPVEQMRDRLLTELRDRGKL